MGLIEGTGGGTSFKPPPVVRRRTVVSKAPSFKNPGEIVAINSLPRAPSFKNPGEIAVINTPKPSWKNPGEIAVINSQPKDPRGEPWIDYVPDLPNGGAAGTPAGTPAQQTSVTDSSKPQPGDTAAQKELQELEDLRMKALNTQLEAIAANFGMTREQLDADMTKTGDDWRAAKAGLMRQSMQQHQSNLDAMAERGIIQSGQRIKGDLRIEEDEATRLTEATRERDYQQAQLAAQLAALAPQQAAEEAAARLSSERSKLDLETMRALAG